MTDDSEIQYIRMTETPVNKLILSLGLPTVVSMLVTNIYNVADTYFVGTIGTSASGATGIVFSLMAILQAFGFMLGHGAGTNISAELGARNHKEACEFAATSFWLSILTGSIICILGLAFLSPLMRLLGSTETILPYARTYGFYILIAGPAFTSGCVMNNILRYEGKAVYAMFGLTSGGILNIFGDWLLVRKFNMGIAGAGLSTTISQYISMVILLLPYLQGKTQSNFNFQYFSKRKTIYKRILNNGMPSMIRQGMNALSTTVLNTYAGAFSDAAVAAISIDNRILNFLLCVALGIGQGFQPVSAFNYGAKIYSRVKKGFYFALKFGTVIMALAGVVAYIYAKPLITLFRDDPDVISIGVKTLRLQCTVIWLIPVSIYGNMLFQSIGRGKTATLLATFRSGLFLIPSVYILTKLYGLSGLQTCQMVAEVCSVIASWPFIRSFLNSLPPDCSDV